MNSILLHKGTFRDESETWATLCHHPLKQWLSFSSHSKNRHAKDERSNPHLVSTPSHHKRRARSDTQSLTSWQWTHV